MTDGITAPNTAPKAQVAALETDLFFAVKIRDTLARAGYVTRVTRTVEGLREALASGEYHLALVNLAARGVDWQAGIHAAHDAGIPVIAYGPHVDLDAQTAARQAGATRVIANSRLDDLPALLGRTLVRANSGQAAADVSEEAPLDEETPSR
jgi:DNA-binding NtrC family response regulator